MLLTGESSSGGMLRLLDGGGGGPGALERIRISTVPFVDGGGITDKSMVS